MAERKKTGNSVARAAKAVAATAPKVYELDLDDPQTPGALDYLASSLDRVGRFDDAEKARTASGDARIRQSEPPPAEPESEASKVERDAVEGG